MPRRLCSDTPNSSKTPTLAEMVVTEERMVLSMEINGLSFTNPEIDDHPPPGFEPSSMTCRSRSIPAIAVFSLDPTAQALFSSNHAFFCQNVVMGVSVSSSEQVYGDLILLKRRASWLPCWIGLLVKLLYHIFEFGGWSIWISVAGDGDLISGESWVYF